MESDLYPNKELLVKLSKPGLIFLLVAILAHACAPKTVTSLSLEIREISPGILEGYLSPRELPSSLILLPPPPREGSTAYQLDLEVAEAFLESKDEERKAQAARDAVLAFPEAVQAFNIILDIPVSKDSTPNLYMILRRTLADAGLSTYAAKNHYQRPRPFMINQGPTCSPEAEDHLKEDGSYPSGHTAIGWTWALILAEIFPDQSDLILQRGKEFGISRNVCNVHWHSDIVAGRMMGTATVARLHADEQFLIDLEAAKNEIGELVRKAEPSE
jgi:acid phosphatase (class A)